MPQATLPLTKPTPRRRADLVEAYQDETGTDSTFVDEVAAVNRWVNDMTAKADIPDGNSAMLRPIGEFLAGVTFQVGGAISRGIDIVSSSLSAGSGGTSSGSLGGAAQPSDYYCR